MSDGPTESSERSPRLDQVIAEYLRSVDAGQPLDEQELIAAHPDLADELRSFFGNREALERIADPLKGAAYDATIDVGQAASLSSDAGARQAGSLPHETIRYFGDYELLNEIARGGMGVVYKGRQVKLNRVVAIKMILSGQLASKEDVQRFYTEAEAAANLDHPGIVPIFEVGEHEGQHYFSMGFVEGESLSAKLANNPLAPREAAELLRQVAQSVQYAHDKGVIHRDLKPANILLDSDGQPRITDFGLAKRIEGDGDLTGTGQILGTPSYMPPEQASGHVSEVRETADVYALGAVLYATLTGRPPFQAASPLDTLMQVLEREPIAPRQLNQSVPLDLETICLKCLEKDRSRRYASAQALIDELQRFLNGEPIQARPIGRPARVWRWCKRNPVLAASGSAVLLATITTIVVLAVSIAWVTASRTKAIALAAEKDEFAQKERGLRKQVEKRSYFDQIALAQKALESQDITTALRYLDRCDEELRGWEHHYLHRLAAPEMQTLGEHRPSVSSVAYSADGKYIVSRSSVGETRSVMKLWDANDRRELLVVQTHNASSVAFSPDGQRFVSGHEILSSGTTDMTLKVRSIGKRQETLTLEKGTMGTFVRSVAFSPDGKRIVSGSRNATVKLWDANSGRKILTIDGARILGPDESLQRYAVPVIVAFSPDSNRIVTSAIVKAEPGEREIKLWDDTTGDELLSFRASCVIDFPSGLAAVAFGPDATRMAGGRTDGAITLWNVTTGREILTIEKSADIVANLAFSPTGDQIVGGCYDQNEDKTLDGKINFWDATTGQKIRTLKTTDPRSLAFSPDGTQILSDSAVWDVNTGKKLFAVNGNAVLSVDGTRLVSGNTDTTVTLWNTSDGRKIGTFKGHVAPVSCVALSPDSKRIVSGDNKGTLKLWDAGKPNEQVVIEGHSRRTNQVCLSPNGSRIATLGRAGEQRYLDLKIWDVETGEEVVRSETMMTSAYGMSFSPDGQTVVAFGGDFTRFQVAMGQLQTSEADRAEFGPQAELRVFDTTNGQEVLALEGHAGPILRAVFTPDGDRVVSASMDKTVKVWDSRSGKEIRSTAVDLGWFQVAISPDTKWLAQPVHTMVFVFESATGQVVHRLGQHAASATSVEFSGDGKRLVSGDDKGALKVWDIQTGKELLSLEGSTAIVRRPAFSPDGTRIVSLAETSDKTSVLKLWDSRSGHEALSIAGLQPVAFSPNGRVIVALGDDGKVKLLDGKPNE